VVRPDRGCPAAGRISPTINGSAPKRCRGPGAGQRPVRGAGESTPCVARNPASTLQRDWPASGGLDRGRGYVLCPSRNIPGDSRARVGLWAFRRSKYDPAASRRTLDIAARGSNRDRRRSTHSRRIGRNKHARRHLPLHPCPVAVERQCGNESALRLSEHCLRRGGTPRPYQTQCGLARLQRPARFWFFCWHWARLSCCRR
jgi:hypothetical protein